MPVANKPVLFYGLEAIRDAGITDVGIVVGDTAAAIQEGSVMGARSASMSPISGRMLRGAWPTRS